MSLANEILASYTLYRNLLYDERVALLDQELSCYIWIERWKFSNDLWVLDFPEKIEVKISLLNKKENYQLLLSSVQGNKFVEEKAD